MLTEAQKQKVEELAQRVLELTKNILTMRLRFMDAAIHRLELVSEERTDASTDGESYYYDPLTIVRQYQKGREYPVRSYLHTLFHCIYRHMFVNESIDLRLWELACDIAVENTINELRLDAVQTEQVVGQEQASARLSHRVKYLTAEVIYDYLKKASLDEDTLKNLEDLFRQDDHSAWFRSKEDEAKGYGYVHRQGWQLEQDVPSADEEADQAAYLQWQAHREQVRQTWQEVSAYMQTALETLERERGTVSLGLTMNIREVNRERYDYTTFLKKFAVLGETMKINDDAFDYIYYTYGLKLYDNVPLIEPLEYKETKRIREFVIALDTSGSTCWHGEDQLSLAQRFVQKTYNILKTTESFFSKVNIHIIQCDAEIQEDVKITSQEEFDAYLKTMKLHGAGGTDFRPVFSYVDQLIEQKEFTNLRGMIYFTDLLGIFPQKQPDYLTAFVYLRDDYEEPEVPPWAIKLVLDEI